MINAPPYSDRDVPRSDDRPLGRTALDIGVYGRETDRSRYPARLVLEESDPLVSQLKSPSIRFPELAAVRSPSSVDYQSRPIPNPRRNAPTCWTLWTRCLVIYILLSPPSLHPSPSIHFITPINPGMPKCTFLSFWVPASLDRDLVFSSQSMA